MTEYRNFLLSLDNFEIFENKEDILRSTDAVSGRLTQKAQDVISTGVGSFFGKLTQYRVPSSNGWIFNNDAIPDDSVLEMKEMHNPTNIFGLGVTSTEGKDVYIAGSWNETQKGMDNRTQVIRKMQFKDQAISLGGKSKNFRFREDWTDAEKKEFGPKPFVIFDTYIPQEFSIVDDGGMAGAKFYSADFDMNAAASNGGIYSPSIEEYEEIDGLTALRQRSRLIEAKLSAIYAPRL